jgi:hypothetical protein
MTTVEILQKNREASDSGIPARREAVVECHRKCSRFDGKTLTESRGYFVRTLARLIPDMVTSVFAMRTRGGSVRWHRLASKPVKALIQ